MPENPKLALKSTPPSTVSREGLLGEEIDTALLKTLGRYILKGKSTPP
jgi:hypothetical protein